ncbi:MAG: ribonuclease H-like YkuK family protein [Flavobacteriaceae bacterium]|tara:strand:- start:159 stop:617 length:459 start_codon:yes stop_codon:yes gene_type:complete
MENSVVFKDIKGNIIDPIDHTREIIKKNPFVEVHVGTDSQSLAKMTQYITVIAYRYGNRGVHYILKKNGVPQIKDLWTRLWRETELSIDIAESIKKSLNVIPEIDLDYNENENFKSNKLVNASKGLANSLGYKVNIKPHIQIATRAADYHCK